MASIVIVDDNPESRELLRTLAAHRGHQAREASDGAEALELVRASPPDLIVSDVLMPTMDGYELVRRLREAPETASTPVIFCTAHFLTKEARALADRCGVRTVLTKPVEPEVLLDAIDRALGGASGAAAEAGVDVDVHADKGEAESFPGTPSATGHQHLRVLADRLSATSIELSAANGRLAALIELSLSMSTERNPDRLLEEFCRAARSLVGARYSGAAAWNDPAKRSVRRWCALGIADELRASLEAPLVPRFLTDPGAARLSTSVEPATAGGRRPAGIPANHPDVRSLLFAPILSMSRVYGWVYLADKIGLEAFSESDAELVGTLAKQVGRIYENGKLYNAVERHTRELEVEIAERRASETKLAERERQLSALFESAMDALIIADDDGRILEGNPAAAELFGLASGELIGRHLWSFVEPRSRGRESWNAIVRAGRTSGEYQVTRADGDTRQIELRATANFIPGRHLSILHDVTERRRLEDQLRRTAKMEAIGRLAGGIAHDFNNLLTVITGNSGLILDGTSADDPHIALLEEIRAAGERSATLTRQLLALSRHQVLSPSVVDLNEIVRGLERLLARIIGEDIRLTTRLAADLGRCEIDTSQIEQVVMNLAVNSRDAMPRGGRLLLETSNARVEPEAAELHGVEAGEYVLLTVSDTGSGMDAETLARLFDPFFTTKAPGRGTGLGLATVYGIVKQSRGHVDVYSELGKGATFHIYFPRVYKSAVIPRRSKETETKGTETILLVEDDDAVRRLTARILNRLGYRVFEADGCEDALSRAESIEGELELLVTDLVMPDGGGRELAERICRLYPETKVLFISGYTDGAIAEHGRLDRNTVFLQKPFSVAALSQKVREALER